MSLEVASLARWRGDPTTFIAEVLRDPETGEPFELNRAERRFLRRAFDFDTDGRLKHPEMVYSCPKKSGKTAFAAIILITVIIVFGGPFAEGYTLANDFEQSVGRVFAAAARIVRASPLLAGAAIVTSSKIEFPELGSKIEAIASDYVGAAGANPTITVFDELWGYVSERSRRLWDEMVPPPTRRFACRLTVTYAGYEGESTLLEGLYKRGLAQPLVDEGDDDLRAGDGLLMFWSHRPVAPWQSDSWLAQMRQQLRPNAYLRLIENRWVTSETTFIDIAWWDECVDPQARPSLVDRGMPVWLGVDASVKRDSTAIVAATWDDEANKVRMVSHRVFQPSPDEPLDFEGTIEATILELAQRFQVVEVRYDPFQMAATAQRLLSLGVPMVEFSQTSAHLTEASSNLYELIKARNLIAYPDEAVRLAVQRAVALETPRGWRIAKEKASHKIDVVVALGMAALGAVQGGLGDSMAVWRRLGLQAIAEMQPPVPTPASEGRWESRWRDDYRRPWNWDRKLGIWYDPRIPEHANFE
jgi:hypothetical protein